MVECHQYISISEYQYMLCSMVQRMELRNFHRGRYLYLAGWPTCWASAHFLVNITHSKASQPVLMVLVHGILRKFYVKYQYISLPVVYSQFTRIWKVTKVIFSTVNLHHSQWLLHKFLEHEMGLFFYLWETVHCVCLCELRNDRIHTGTHPSHFRQVCRPSGFRSCVETCLYQLHFHWISLYYYWNHKCPWRKQCPWRAGVARNADLNWKL